MLRGEYCICGTSSTGTGTLNLAACPAPPGGTDLYQAFNAQSLGTAVGIPISYTIVEYTGSTFQTARGMEKGVGTLTLGANIAATTLARTTVQQTSTSMDTTPTYNTAEPSAMSIAVAANTLVFIGSSASDLVPSSPYFDRTLAASDGIGALPVNIGGQTTSNIIGTFSGFAGTDHYHLFEWRVPMLAKRIYVSVTATITGIGTNVMYGRLYAVGANARPTKLLYNFGTFVSSSVLKSIGQVATSATGSGFYMDAGEYYLDIFVSNAGAISGTARLAGFSQAYNAGRLGYATGIGVALELTATSGSPTPGDPANITSLNIYGGSQLFFGISTT